MTHLHTGQPIPGLALQGNILMCGPQWCELYQDADGGQWIGRGRTVSPVLRLENVPPLKPTEDMYRKWIKI